MKNQELDLNDLQKIVKKETDIINQTQENKLKEIKSKIDELNKFFEAREY